MKTTMKFLTHGLLILTLVFTSCSKDGDTGPIGPAGTPGLDGIAGTDGTDGTDGVDGTDGTNGTNGNADVQILEFGAKTFTTTTTYLMTGVSESDTNENLFLAFYGRVFTEVSGNGGILEKTQWIPVPGKGHNNLFESSAVIETSSFATNSNYIVNLYNPNGTDYNASTSFQKFKIFIAPPSSVSGKSNSELSKMSYKAFTAHFGLEE